MDTDTTLKQFPDGLHTLNCCSRKTVELAHNQCIPFLKFFQKLQELRAIHRLPGECLFYDLLATVFLKGGNLIFQTVSVPALGGG